MLHIGRYFAFTRKHDTSHTSFFHTKIRLGNLRTLELYTLIWGIILPRIWTTFRFDMLHVELIILLLFYTLQARLRLQWESWFLSSPPCLPSFSDSTSLYKKEALLKGKTKKKKGSETKVQEHLYFESELPSQGKPVSPIFGKYSSLTKCCN